MPMHIIDLSIAFVHIVIYVATLEIGLDELVNEIYIFLLSHLI